MNNSKNNEKPCTISTVSSSAYDEKKDFTCSCLYTCNRCLEADKLGVSRSDYYDEKENDDWDY